ncbi:hypothetical protein EC973_006918 [Apophysomyces ossiformis]|uniref:F-box domain-containing protein n=1 Tax=Apophysomyces ossiformis TaxID=679940 RepID=A0A8H7BQG7_9FUNG|nr:hypothetical protein EC973_006918 [Apophysomyces ossiformis]
MISHTVINAPINQLSHELLLAIAACLPRNKLCILVTVCRSWNAALTPELYRLIYLKSQTHFELFFNTVIALAPHKRLDHHVRQLRIKYYGTKSNVLHGTRLFPFVTEIAGNVFGNEALIPVMKQWKALRKITTVYDVNAAKHFPTDVLRNQLITLSVNVSNVREWISLIPQLQNLEELCIIYDGYSLDKTDRSLSYSDLDNIHNNLLHLRKLCLERVALNGQLPDVIKPCNTMKELSLQPISGDSCGYYFAKKYTQLQILNVSCDTEDDDDPESAILPLIKSCRYLTYLFLSDDELYPTCFDILEDINAPLTELSYTGLYNISQFWKTLSSFHKTLTDITISDVQRIHFKEVITQLKLCPALVDLYLRRFDHKVDLDWILNELNGLKSLELEANIISVQQNHCTSIHRQLKTLVMQGSDVEDEVYLYLSKCCPRISYLSSYLDCPYSYRFSQRYSYQYRRSRMIYYPRPFLAQLNWSINGRYLFKLTQVDKAVPFGWDNKIDNRTIEQLDAMECTKWLLSQDRTIKQLDASEVENIIADLQSDDGDKRSQWSDLDIISVICYYAADLNLCNIPSDKFHYV